MPKPPRPPKPTRAKETAIGLAQVPKSARAMYVFAHGAGAGAKHHFMQSMADALAARGIATLRWEFPYMAAGKSRPDAAPIAEAAVRATIAAAATAYPKLPLFAGGKSFGGRMTSRAHAAEPLPVRGLAFLGFPLHPPEKPGIERAEHLATAAGPLLFLSGNRDELAQIGLLAPVVRGLGPRAELQIIDDADHGFFVRQRSGRGGDQVIEELADAMSKWIARVVIE